MCALVLRRSAFAAVWGVGGPHRPPARLPGTPTNAHPPPQSAAQRRCSLELDRVLSAVTSGGAGRLELAPGIGFAAGPGARVARRGDAAALVVGTPAGWPALSDADAEAADVAERLLDLVLAWGELLPADAEAEAQDLLAGLEGAWAFVAHDAGSERVFAARDAAGEQARRQRGVRCAWGDMIVQ